MLKKNWNNSEIGEGLGVAEESDSRVGLGDGSEEFEDAAEAADSEEGELGASVLEAGAESEGDFSVHSLAVE